MEPLFLIRQRKAYNYFRVQNQHSRRKITTHLMNTNMTGKGCLPFQWESRKLMIFQNNANIGKMNYCHSLHGFWCWLPLIIKQKVLLVLCAWFSFFHAWKPKFMCWNITCDIKDGISKINYQTLDRNWAQTFTDETDNLFGGYDLFSRTFGFFSLASADNILFS